MNTLTKVSSAALAALMLASSGVAMAATHEPIFTSHPGLEVNGDEFVAGLGYYNPGDVKALLNASTINVITYGGEFAGAPGANSSVGKPNHAQNTDRSDPADRLAAMAPEISKIQADLNANPAAVALLKSHNISVSQVQGIEVGRDGVVSLYIL